MKWFDSTSPYTTNIFIFSRISRIADDKRVKRVCGGMCLFPVPAGGPAAPQTQRFTRGVVQQNLPCRTRGEREKEEGCSKRASYRLNLTANAVLKRKG